MEDKCPACGLVYFEMAGNRHGGMSCKDRQIAQLKERLDFADEECKERLRECKGKTNLLYELKQENAKLNDRLEAWRNFGKSNYLLGFRATKAYQKLKDLEEIK